MVHNEYVTGRVTITVDYGYDVHTLIISGRTFDRVKSGKPLEVKGQGFDSEGERLQDYWAFNTRERGSLEVTYEGAGEIFIGELASGEVTIKDLRASERGKTR